MALVRCGVPAICLLVVGMQQALFPHGRWSWHLRGSTTSNDGGQSDGKQIRRMWVSLLAGSANSSAAVELQIKSVQRFSSYPHMTLVTPDIDEASCSRIQRMGSHILRVEEIKPNWEIPGHWSKLMAKLHLFNFTEVDQFAYIDTDAFLVREADKIFIDCETEFCGVRDGASSLTKQEMLNAGVMIFRTVKASLLLVAQCIGRHKNASKLF
jgi:hypothetical protein